MLWESQLMQSGWLIFQAALFVNFMATKGVGTDVDKVLITSGSQQGLDLVAKAFLSKGDKNDIRKMRTRRFCFSSKLSRSLARGIGKDRLF